MSDNFDKEAEREKLRKKYEQDKQEREATEQMSELLLQGATMTNSHCSECGDPIFRYDGQEFCPTCEKPIDSQPENGESTDDDSIQVRSPSDEAQVKFGSAGDEQETHSQRTDQPQDKQTPDHHQQTTNQQARGTPEPQQPPETQTPRGQAQESPVAATGEGGLAAAEQSLVRTLARFSQQAEATDDPRKAKEQLEAAREAAQALAALRQ